MTFKWCCRFYWNKVKFHISWCIISLPWSLWCQSVRDAYCHSDVVSWWLLFNLTLVLLPDIWCLFDSLNAKLIVILLNLASGQMSCSYSMLYFLFLVVWQPTPIIVILVRGSCSGWMWCINPLSELGQRGYASSLVSAPPLKPLGDRVWILWEMGCFHSILWPQLVSQLLMWIYV